MPSSEPPTVAAARQSPTRITLPEDPKKGSVGSGAATTLQLLGLRKISGLQGTGKSDPAEVAPFG
jgi:hypothetical protein